MMSLTRNLLLLYVFGHSLMIYDRNLTSIKDSCVSLPEYLWYIIYLRNTFRISIIHVK